MIKHLSKFDGYYDHGERYKALLEMFAEATLVVNGIKGDFNEDEKESLWMEMGEILNAGNLKTIHELADNRSKFNHLRTAYHILIVGPLKVAEED